MPDNKPIYIVIVAGGQGVRMGTALPKQFLNIGGKPILYYTIKAFLDSVPQSNIVVVLPENDISKFQIVLTHFESGINLTIVEGGNNRFESVKNGLKNIPNNAIILVHDGVRPFISSALISKCISEAYAKGSAIPVIKVEESIRQISGNSSKAVDRSAFRIVQTPQVFKSEIILPAFEQNYQQNFTDEASVVESFGREINLIEGEKSNIKITTQEDLERAEYILTQCSS